MKVYGVRDQAKQDYVYFLFIDPVEEEGEVNIYGYINKESAFWFNYDVHEVQFDDMTAEEAFASIQNGRRFFPDADPIDPDALPDAPGMEIDP